MCNASSKASDDRVWGTHRRDRSLSSICYQRSILLPLADGVPGSGQRGHAFRSDSHQSQDTDSHDRSFATKMDQAHFSTGLAPRQERAPRPMEELDGEELDGDELRGQDAVSPCFPSSV